MSSRYFTVFLGGALNIISLAYVELSGYMSGTANILKTGPRYEKKFD